MSTEKSTQTSIPENLSDQIWSTVFRHKLFWVLGIISALASTASGDLSVRFVWSSQHSSFPYRFLHYIWLLEIPRIDLVEWLLDQEHSIVFALGCSLALWCLHFVAQGGILRAAYHLIIIGKPNFTQSLLQSLRGDWLRLLLLNLLMFGALYLTIIVGLWFFRRELYSAGQVGILGEADWQLVEQYNSRPHRIVGFVLACLLVPTSLIAPLIYPFAKRSLLLGKHGIFASLNHAIRLMRQNLWGSAGVIIYAGCVYIGIAVLFAVLLHLMSLLGVVDSEVFTQGNSMSLPILLVTLVVAVVSGYAMSAISLFATAYYINFEEKYKENLLL